MNTQSLLTEPLNMSPIVRFRTTSAVEDTAEFDSLEEALAACRDDETVTVAAYRPGEGSPFWAAVEVYRQTEQE